MLTLHKIYQAIVPKKIRALKSQIKEKLFWDKKRKIVKKIIVNNLESQAINEILTEEIKEILSYLRKNELRMMPYSFPDKYNYKNIKVKTDSSNGLRYVLHENKKLYFKLNWSVNKIKNYYSYLLAEQDDNSPHRYLTSEFQVIHGDVVVDAGAAEGIFSLNVIDRIKKIYLFEPDLDWVEALKATFNGYTEKVVIIPKGLSNNSNEGFLKLDIYLGGQSKVNFIKLDIEGWELEALKGSSDTLSFSADIKIAVCTYHRHDDEKRINEYLNNMNFQCKTSGGYVINFYDDRAPYLRRCLIRAKKNCQDCR